MYSGFYKKGIKMPTRELKINFKDNTSKILNIKKSSIVNLTNDKEFIYLERMPDGDWRLTWTNSLVEDWSNVVNLEMIRND